MPSDPGAPQAAGVRGVSLLFLGNGLTFSSLVPRFPDLRASLDVGLGTIGTILLVASVGGLLGGAIAARAGNRLEPRRFAFLGAATLGLAMPALGLWTTAPLAFGTGMFLLGMVDANADIGMNLLATEMDRRSSRSLIHRFHAIWSVGTLVGAGIGSAGAVLDVSLGIQLLVSSGLQLGLAVVAFRALPSEVGTTAPGPDAVVASEGSPWVDPGAGPVEVSPDAAVGAGSSGGRVAVLLAATAAAMAYLEGTPSQWASLFADDVHGANAGLSGLAFAATTAGMVVGRFAGDHLTDRVGPARLQSRALATAAAGALVVVGSPDVVIAIVGFLLAGLGASVLFPALYASAAAQPRLSPAAGLAAMSTGLRLGFLSAPVVVGFLADSRGMRLGYGFALGLALAATVVSAAAFRRD